MKQAAVTLLICVLLSSCATIMNQPRDRVTIYTTKPSTIVINKDSVKTSNNRVTLSLPRSKEALKIVAITDSSKKTVSIPAKNSGAYYGNIFFNYGLGMLVDKNSQKRYSYPSNVYLNSADTLNRFYRYGNGNQRGTVLLDISIPYVNMFLFRPVNENAKSHAGFWGISGGLDYYYGAHQYINFSASAAIDFLIPFPAPLDRRGDYETMRSTYLTLSNNTQVHRFLFGYGISFARNSWAYHYNGEFTPALGATAPANSTNNALGLVFSSYYKVNPVFNIGLVYRPTLSSFNAGNNLLYEHLISIDLAWKIKLTR